MRLSEVLYYINAPIKPDKKRFSHITIDSRLKSLRTERKALKRAARRSSERKNRPIIEQTELILL